MGKFEISSLEKLVATCAMRIRTLLPLATTCTAFRDSRGPHFNFHRHDYLCGRHRHGAGLSARCEARLHPSNLTNEIRCSRNRGLRLAQIAVVYCGRGRPPVATEQGAFEAVMHTLRSNVVCPAGVKLRMSTA